MRIAILFCLIFWVTTGQAQETASEEEIYMVADEMPLFPGCDAADAAVEDKRKCSDQNLLQFIYNYIQYPDSARAQGIEGSVVVQFVVEKDGKITNGKVLKDIGGGCGEEALRVVDLMNKIDRSWSPGKKNGQPVRVSFNLPIKFKLETVVPPEYTLLGQDTIWSVYDVAAQFRGGEEDLVNSIQNDLDYPNSGLSTCRVGALQIQLMVKKDDEAQLLDITDFGNLGLDFWYETVAWFNSTKKEWTPAQKEGRGVGSIYSMRVPFKPSENIKLDSACIQKISDYDVSTRLAFEGESEFYQGNKEAAYEKWKEAYELFPENAELLMLRGQAALEDGNLELACADLRKAKAILGVAGWVEQMLFWTCQNIEATEQE